MAKLERFHIAEKKFSYDKNFSVTRGKDVFEKMVGEFECMNCYEEMFCMYLNNKNNILGIAKIGQGNDCSTIANIKLGMKTALDLQARGMILIHNHPSDMLVPSQADKNLTKEFVSACKIFSIDLLDSIIIGESGYFSFMEEGIL